MLFSRHGAPGLQVKIIVRRMEAETEERLRAKCERREKGGGGDAGGAGAGAGGFGDGSLVGDSEGHDGMVRTPLPTS